MPVPEVESLGQGAEDEQVKAALSACIAQEVQAGRDREQAVAMCYSMIRERTGKELSP